MGLVGTRQLTWRRFGSLLIGLPGDSQFKVQFAADRASEMDNDGIPEGVSEWSLTNQLLASVVDLLALANYQRGGGKGSKPKLLTARANRSARPDPSLDVRAILAAMGPVSEQEEDPAE